MEAMPVRTTFNPPEDAALQLGARNRESHILRQGDPRLFFVTDTAVAPEVAVMLNAANEAASQMWAESTWSSRLSVGGRFAEFCEAFHLPHDRMAIAAFLFSKQLKASTRVQYAKWLRDMVLRPKDPLDALIQGLQRCAAKEDKRQARPLKREEMFQILDQLPFLDQRVALRLAWITASRWGEVGMLRRRNFVIQPDKTVIVDWAAIPKTAQLDPNCGARYVRIAGYDAEQLLRVLRPLRPDDPFTTLSESSLLKKLRTYGCTKHSIKRGAIHHLATLMAENGGQEDIRVLSQMAKHKTTLDVPSSTVGYAGPTLGNLAKVNKWVAKL